MGATDPLDEVGDVAVEMEEGRHGNVYAIGVDQGGCIPLLLLLLFESIFLLLSWIRSRHVFQRF
jgi:hypothetical protein